MLLHPAVLSLMWCSAAIGGIGLLGFNRLFDPGQGAFNNLGRLEGFFL